VPKLSRAATGGLAAVALTLALGLSVAPAALPAAAQTTSAAHGAARRVAPGAAPAPGRRVRRAVSIGETSVDSLNSAGYAVSRAGTRFRLVRATFFVPYLNCALSKSAYSQEWVGLGGFVGSSVTVQQVGIEADCNSAGRGSYHTWYAMYPRPAVNPKLKISAGDSVTASVYYDAASARFALSLTDNTTGGHFTVTQPCPRGLRCPALSAEIISSAPTARKGKHLVVKPLADYGAVSYAAITITDHGGQRSGLRSAFWGDTKILQTEQAASFQLISRPTQIQADTFDTYWSREN
jgi:hypothetical protein